MSLLSFTVSEISFISQNLQTPYVTETFSVVIHPSANTLRGQTTLHSAVLLLLRFFLARRCARTGKLLALCLCVVCLSVTSHN